FGGVGPIDFRAKEGRPAGRMVDGRVGIGAARFEEEDGGGGVGAEPVGEDAPGGAGADEDVVVFGGHRMVPPSARNADAGRLTMAGAVLAFDSSWPLDGDPAASAYLDFQLMTSQELHADQWIGVCFVDEDSAHRAVPGQPTHIHVELEEQVVRLPGPPPPLDM